MTATTIFVPPAELAWRLHPSKLSVVGAVIRKMVPYLIEATLVPTVLFYAFLIAMNLSWAFVAAMAWTYCAVARRLVSRRPIPALLLLACLGITVRTVVYLCSGSTFVYFMQPIVRTLATAGVFALSVLIGRPLIARFASDFCHLSPEVQERPAIDRLFRRLTYLWAFINLAAACASLTLLLTVPTAVFVGTATLAAWIITCTGLVLTVSASVRTARSEGLATAVAPGGALRAYIAAPL
ncbi:MAG: VC0807 family protein [Acidimicrobiales bacterium]